MQIQRGNGKVHTVSPTHDDRFMPLPECGGNRSAEGYHTTNAPVDCKKCLVILEKAAAKAETTTEGETVTTETNPRDAAFEQGRALGMDHAEAHDYAARVVATSENPDVTGHQGAESANVAPGNTNQEDQGETMAENTTTEAPKLDVTEEAGKAALEQIDANIERAKVLATEDNAEALEELGKETETIISNLSGKGSIKAKKEKRDAWKAAVEAAAKPKAEVKKVSTGTVQAKTWDQYEGTKELVNLGAQKVAEGITAHVKVSNLAKEIADITLDVALRIPNKADTPDIMFDSDAAKKAARAVYDEALPLFEDNYDNASALKKLIRSAQDFRSDARAQWLRSLDQDDETGAERRAIMGKVLEGKPEDVPASEWVANVYGTSTIGQAERKRLAYQEKKNKELTANGEPIKTTGEGGEGEGEGEGEGSGTSAETTTPDERVTKVTEKIIKDITSAKPEDFEASSDETKEAVRKRLEEAKKAITAMIAATL
ncbi:immunity repressor [Streptomyces phage Rowa]|uniref:Immunity repressor n=1 Tax=Streptomyces phage Rowa TaxID=2059883 RepID=A0A2H5BLT0_9CAUD|nr:immunity repressor [Streptomyces phage Rowa]AUG87290.1 immunity repressor [Streptomyces phage Rowa]